MITEPIGLEIMGAFIWVFAVPKDLFDAKVKDIYIGAVRDAFDLDAPMDANPDAMEDERSGDIGCGVKCFSQNSVAFEYEAVLEYVV